MGTTRFGRVTLIVMDSAGIGEMPDAAEWGDAGSNTIGHVLESRDVRIPNMQKMGLANIRPLAVPPVTSPIGSFGRCALASNGKDTTTGHWEMAGIITEVAFPTYPHGFPPRIVDEYTKRIGRGILGNKAASGTEIIAELGEEHMKTGKPIVYTSADSVFQVAAHEEIIPIEELYRICQIARDMLTGQDQVGRVIARPFIGTPGHFTRTERRKDYAIEPPIPTLLDRLSENGHPTICVGKIASIYDYKGVTEEIKAKNNMALVDKTVEALKRDCQGFIFTNLVDFDMLYGHRNDVEGYAKALEDFDARLPEIMDAMRPDDLLMITADHGCDPSIKTSTDHTREYVPLLVYGKHSKPGVDLGIRKSLADIGETIAANFNLDLGVGTSFLSQIA
ncbi:MAG TPA: phosphopentomutase [Blastocatellia bacterium]|nr:phosphopentomutase [Blastocatellia bacterium]